MNIVYRMHPEVMEGKVLPLQIRLSCTSTPYDHHTQ